VGSAAFPLYSHRCSPKKFTQPQLFAGLVLKEFLRLDYRKLMGLLTDASELAKTIGLTTVPHFTTFQKAADRLLRAPHTKALLDATLERAQQQKRIGRRIELAAIDGSGFEARQASHYYVRRRAKGGKTWQDTTYTRFPKAILVSDCATHLVVSVVTSRGPSPDIPHFRAALRQAITRHTLGTLAGDAGFDAEHAHEFARHECGVKTLIPSRIGRPTQKKPSGRWRRWMAAHLHHTRYSQRWQCETVNSMLKRLQGSALRARTYWSQTRELHLRIITHNLMILRRKWVFYRAFLTPFPSPRGTSTAYSRTEDWRAGLSIPAMQLQR